MTDRQLYQTPKLKQRREPLGSAATSELGRVIRYGLVGSGAALTHLAVAWVCVAIGFWPGLANAAGFVCGFGVSYVGQSRFTFALGTGSGAILLRWFGLQLTLLGLSSLGVQFLTQRFGFPTMPTILIAIGLVAIIGFAAGRFWIFRAPKS